MSTGSMGKSVDCSIAHPLLVYYVEMPVYGLVNIGEHALSELINSLALVSLSG